jgi:hypothetical protein
VSLRIEADASRALAELDRLSRGPDPGTFEVPLAAATAAVASRVHKISGRLAESGHPSSEMSEGRWEGTLAYARYPGIFELARGNRPTGNHPEGKHFFFDPGGEDFLRGVRRALVAYVTDGEESELG